MRTVGVARPLPLDADRGTAECSDQEAEDLKRQHCGHSR
jgi:hypothetical protein